MQYYTLGDLFFSMILAMGVLFSLTRDSPASSYTAEMSVGSRLVPGKAACSNVYLR